MALNTWKEVADFGMSVGSTPSEASVSTSDVRATMESIQSISGMDVNPENNILIQTINSHLDNSINQLNLAKDYMHIKPDLKDYVEKVIKYINLVKDGINK